MTQNREPIDQRDTRDIIEIEDTIDPREYLQVIIKHRRIIAAIFSCITLAGLIYCLTATPIYQATAGIIIEKENNSASLQEYMFSYDSPEYYQTMQRILESRSVARKVIKRLGLDKNEMFFPQERDEQTDNKTLENKMVDVFLARLKIVPVMKSYNVNISFQSEDPELAALVVNSIVDAYREHSLHMRLDSVKNSVQWLSSNLEKERKKVEAAQQALLSYKEQQGIVTDFTTNTETITAQKLAQLNNQVAEAEAARTDAQTRYKQAEALAGKADQLDAIPDVLNNELIRQIKTQEVALVQKISELSKKYGINHPQMLALQAEQKTLQVKKEQEVNRVLTSLSNTYEVMLVREKSLKDALAAQKNETFNLNRSVTNYIGLYCEAEGAQAMYALLLKRLKETSVTENLNAGNIRIVDEAEVPQRPIKPKKFLYMLTFIVIGLGLSLGAAFLLEYFDNTIDSPDDVKQYLRIPFLGLISLNSTGGADVVRASAPAFEVFLNPRSIISEAYRSIRTNIFYSLPDTEPQVMLITSALAQEGKTTSAINIAITMAQFGHRVILVDCDFHRPQMRRLFEIQPELGMTNLLVGNKKLDEVVCSTMIPNLQVIPSGHIPPNPSEILGSRKMKDIIGELRRKFDKIIIDSAPVATVTDSLMAARAVDGTVLVVRADSTPRAVAMNAVEALKSVDATILGAVVNGLDIRKAGHSYYPSYHHYHYSYSYADSDQTSRPRNLIRKLPSISRKELKKFFRG